MAVNSTGSKGQPYFDDTLGFDLGVDQGAISDYAAAVGNRKVGTAAARAALSGSALWAGLEYLETDTGLRWVYSGVASAWYCPPQKLTPLQANVTGGTVQPNGDVLSTAIAAVKLDQVFNFSNFLRYRIVVAANTFSVGTAWINWQGVQSGAVDGSASYAYTRMKGQSDTSSLAEGDVQNGTNLPLTLGPVSTAGTQSAEYHLSKVSSAARMTGVALGTTTVGGAIRILHQGTDYYPSSPDSSAVTGFQISASSAATAVFRIAVFGE